MKITELLAWLESKAPYSTAEGDRRHAEIAALVRALEAVRLVALKVNMGWSKPSELTAPLAGLRAGRREKK